jgi:hypothetical protein
MVSSDVWKSALWGEIVEIPLQYGAAALLFPAIEAQTALSVTPPQG